MAEQTKGVRNRKIVKAEKRRQAKEQRKAAKQNPETLSRYNRYAGWAD